MNQIEAFTVVADQLANDMIRGHVLPKKEKATKQAYRVIVSLLRRRTAVQLKRQRRVSKTL